MSNTLLPCPFCGGEALMRERYINGVANTKHYRHECRGCKATFANWYRSMKKAAEAWNRRAEDERYKNALKEIIQLACESVEREKTLAKLEAEVMALEPKCGEWVKKTYTHEYANEETEERQYVVCSICGKQPPSGFGTVYYCHNCGARMEEHRETD